MKIEFKFNGVECGNSFVYAANIEPTLGSPEEISLLVDYLPHHAAAISSAVLRMVSQHTQELSRLIDESNRLDAELDSLMFVHKWTNRPMVPIEEPNFRSEDGYGYWNGVYWLPEPHKMRAYFNLLTDRGLQAPIGQVLGLFDRLRDEYWAAIRQADDVSENIQKWLAAIQ